MANNNVNVNLSFTADTSKAQQQLQSLQQSLNNITNSTSIGGKLGITDKIQEGIRAASELQVHLQKAVNIDTGNLDFSKLSQSLKQSGTSLQQYATKLQGLGPTGQQAFQQLAQSVAQSEIPLKRTSSLLAKMGTTLTNTIRWQISTSILNNFTGAIQKAYGYAQDLNESLNNIRIVTGKNIDEMAEFAKEANKAAKALSTTTTAYTDASLIFYQQGLDGADVQKRTDIVVKMANVTKQSVEDTSNQLTAIWNNFYDGTKSLEYYADVLTKLGAATASSTDEIAGGLEKFAAIGDTIGLSYEYAASALATITAKTRQSEEVVGTALKTIFGRIQGLKLGETLEDGTSLNKYSEALKTVGVSIYDQAGNLKIMDTILDELGSKWNTISKDQQVALAQTVGGMRQYNQIISLMDNWDFMQENINTAVNATGELNEQSKIYEESWEAASKRVQASLEETYSKFINDEFFIDLTDGLAKFVDMVNNLVDSMGGLDGLLMGIGVLVTRVFSNQMANGIVKMADGLKLMTKRGQEALANERALFLQNAAKQVNPNGNVGTAVEKAREQALMHEVELSETLRKNAAAMSDLELEANKIMLDRQRALDQENIRRQEILETTKQQLLEEKKRREMEIAGLDDEITAETYDNSRKGSYTFLGTSDALGKYRGVINSGIETQALAHHLTSSLGNDIDPNTEKGKNKILELQQSFKDLQKVAEEAGIKLSDDLDAFIADLEKGVVQGDKFKTIINDIAKTGKAGNQKAIDANNDLKREIEERVGTGRTSNNIIKKVDESFKGKQKIAEDKYKKDPALKEAEDKARETNEAVEESFEKTNKSFEQGVGNIKHWSQGLVSAANSAMSLGMALSSLQGAWNTLQDPDMSGWEKFLSLSTSLGMAIPMLVSSMSGLNSMLGFTAAIKSGLISTQGIYNTLLKDEAMHRAIINGLMAVQEGANKEEIANELVSIGLKKGKITLEEQEIAKKAILNMLEAQGADTIKKSIMWTNLQTSADKGNILAKSALVVATKLGIVTKNAETGAVIANTAAWYANPITWIAAVILGVVAVISLLVVGFKSLNEALNADKVALEQLEQQLETSTKAYEKAKEAVDEFKNTVSSYEEGVNALKDLTKGTNEFNLKLQETNDQAYDLINKFGLIADKDFSINKNTGLIEFSDDLLNNLEKQLIAESNMKKRFQAEDKIRLQNELNSRDQNKFISNANFESRELLKTYFADIGEKEQYKTNEGIWELLKQYGQITSNQTFNNLPKNLQDIVETIRLDIEEAEKLKEAQQEQTKALYENTKALMHSEYSPELLNKYGEAAVLGAESIILENRVKDKLGGQNAWQYINNEINGDKINTLSEIDIKNLENLYGLENGETLRNGTINSVEDREGNLIGIKISQNGTDGDEDDKIFNLSELDYAFLSSLEREIKETDYDKFFETSNNYNQALKRTSELYNVDTSGEQIYQAGGWSGISKEQREQLTTAGRDTKEVQDYIKDIQDLAIKKGTVEELLKLTQDDITKEGGIIQALQKAEIEASYATSAGEAGMDIETFKLFTKEVQKQNPKLKENSKELIQVATAQAKLDKKIKTMTEQYDDLKDSLDKSKKGTTEYAEAQAKLLEIVNNGLDLDIDKSYLATAKGMENVKKAAEGNAAAIQELINQEQKETSLEFGVDLSLPENAEIENLLNGIVDGINVDDIEIGTTLDEVKLTDNYQKLLDAGIYTANQLRDILKIEGYEVPEFEMVKVKINDTIYNSQTGNWEAPNPTDPDNPIIVPIDSSNTISSEGFYTFPKLKGDSVIKVKNAQTISNSITKNKPKDKSGSSSKKKTKKSDVVDRYKPITAKLEKQADVLSELNDLQDKLYGTDRLDNIDRYIDSLEKENKLLDEKLKLNKQYKQEDLNALQNFAKKEGLSLKFDTEGNLENEIAIQEMFWKQIKSAEDAGKESDKIKEKADLFKDLAETYAESLEIATEILQEKITNFYEAIEKATEKYDIQLELFEKDAEKLRKKVDESYGTDYFIASQNLSAELKKSEDYINNTALPQVYNQRRDLINDLKKYGIKIDENTMTATNETEALSKLSAEDKAEAQALLGGLGLYNQKVEELFGKKEEIYDEVDEIRWAQFDKVVELKGVITDLEFDKIELKKALLKDKEWSKGVQLEINSFNVSEQAIKDQVKAWNDLMAIPENLRDADWNERVQEIAPQMIDSVTSALEQLEQVNETIKESFSEINEKAMETINLYGQVTDTLDHYKNLVEALNGEIDYESIDSILKADLDNTKSKLTSLTQYRDEVLMPQQRKLEQDIAKGMYTGEALDKAKEQLRNLNEAVRENGNEINSAIEEIANKSNEILENATEQAMVNFEKAVTGGLRFDELLETIDRLTKKQEEYLTKTNQLYETNKMIRQAQLDMNKTDNLMAKQRYQDFIKETQQLAAQEKLSQQDLKIAQARYQLLQAQIALEEARKAKDSMKLVRGADGNWDYVYTANQDRIEDAEGKVADAENSLYNLGLEGAQDYRDKILELDREFNEKAAEINLKYKNDEKKRQQELNDLLKHHLTLRNTYEQEYYKAYNLLVSESATGYADYMLGNITATQDFEKEALDLYESLDSVTSDWAINSAEASDVVYGKYDNLEDKLFDVYKVTNNISSQVDELIPQLSNEALVVGSLAKEYLNLYNNKKKALELQASNAENAANIAQQEAGGTANKIDSAYAGIDWSQEMLKAQLGTSDYSYGEAYKNREEKVKITGNDYGFTTKQLNDILHHATINKYLTELLGQSITKWYEIAKGHSFAAFDTGGYTGSWGSDGKFAMLHQKELVLNAEDTQNIFAAVDIVRQLSKDLDLRASAYTNALSQIKAVTNPLTANDTLQQEVTIHADFPNVTSRDEIEAAFDNLVNEASQYVKEKRLRGF